MRFFKFLAIAFPVYVGIASLASYFLNSNIQLPTFIDVPLQFVAMSLIVFTLLFTPLLKSLGMYVTAYWSLPTTGGIVLSLLIWEIIFILIFVILRKRYASN